MKIKNNDKKQYISINYKYSTEGYTTYDIEGKSDYFSGKSTICFNDARFLEFKNNIKKLKIGDFSKINDNDSDSYIEIYKIDGNGHYDIITQIGGSHQHNFCKIIINTDQLGIENF